MSDRITKDQRSRIMSSIKSKNTSLEIYFKNLLAKNKINGYKSHQKVLGSPDIVFASKKIAIFVDGDFWHGYNWKKLGKVPPKKYWQAKIERNISRDKKYTKQLKKNGWIVLRFWEHEIRKNPEKCLLKVKNHLTAAAPTPRNDKKSQRLRVRDFLTNVRTLSRGA